jgi:hypothetical protein
VDRVISTKKVKMSYKLSKKSGFYGLLSVLLVSSGWMVATSARAQNVIDIFRQIAPANVRPYIPTSTPNSNSTSAPNSNTSSDSSVTKESQDPNLAFVVFKTSVGAVKVNGSTTVAGFNSSMAHVRLLQCIKIPNSKNLPGYPKLSYYDRGKKFKSMVCNFSIKATTDVTADFSIDEAVDGASAVDFRGNIMNAETMIVNKEVEHHRLTVQIVKNKPFSLTAYFRYKETDKQITRLRSLSLSIRSSEQSNYQMARFKNVNVGEEK